MVFFIRASILFLILLLPALVFATDVRGRVDTKNAYNGYYQPLSRAEVALVNPATNKSTYVTQTGRDGFYYFYDISPGNYLLVVNRTLKIPVNIPNLPGFDINPVLFK